MLFPLSELIGYSLEGEDVCMECLGKEDGVIKGFPLLEDFVDPGEVLTCDRCGEILIINTANLKITEKTDSSEPKKKIVKNKKDQKIKDEYEGEEWSKSKTTKN